MCETSQMIEKPDFRVPICLIARAHHSQGHFQQGVQTQTKQLKGSWSVGVHSSSRSAASGRNMLHCEMGVRSCGMSCPACAAVSVTEKH